ncbi:hypothetical protein DCAR_0312489 [Daucus carota subsp. sativus]|uniref:Uncharacterized protein n=1 Tax=Daucus carota subsp. sativus TaxID=79200 RepID=A0A166B1X6_DAUCS|nr:hypothetical protein DCAR_0312489 [Daucus carota subsp. sativus]
MALIKLVGLLLMSLLFVSLRGSSANVHLGRKMKSDKLMASKEKYTPEMGIPAQDSLDAHVEEEGDEARKMVNKEDIDNEVESSKKLKSSGAAHNARKTSCNRHHEDKDEHVNSSSSCNMLIHKSRIIGLNEEELEAAEREVMELMRRDYRSKPRRKPPINNNKPNN